MNQNLTVRDVPESAMFVQDPVESRELVEHVGASYDGGAVFVTIEKGEITGLWVAETTTPYLGSPVERVHPEGSA